MVVAWVALGVSLLSLSVNYLGYRRLKSQDLTGARTGLLSELGEIQVLIGTARDALYEADLLLGREDGGNVLVGAARRRISQQRTEVEAMSADLETLYRENESLNSLDRAQRLLPLVGRLKGEAKSIASMAYEIKDSVSKAREA